MIRDDDKWVREMFDSSMDWSCPSFADRVLYSPVSLDCEVTRRCASILSALELRRADGFVTDEDRALFIQRRAFRRYCGALARGSRLPLSQIVFEETENGRPWLSDSPDLSFSFSSCRAGFVGAWSASHNIGIDLEDPATTVEPAELARTYFNESEALAVETARAGQRQKFLQLWSLKEAALKSIGEGLPFGLDAFEFELDDVVRIVEAPHEYGGPRQFGAYLFDQPGLFSAIVAHRRRLTVSFNSRLIRPIHEQYSKPLLFNDTPVRSLGGFFLRQ
ncbi:MAG TPA: 4'-phosphopantetheinyl transferase superfamily protein [Pyrinomonadaceae bacterium]|nr:4'-phosphopantetheinyl transferase superfamily protein [Pyrinomonadaceae bacterium]